MAFNGLTENSFGAITHCRRLNVILQSARHTQLLLYIRTFPSACVVSHIELDVELDVELDD